MVIFFVTRPHHYTLADVLAAVPRGSVAVAYYGYVFAAKQLPRATYVFSDLERLNPPDRARGRAPSSHGAGGLQRPE